MAVRPTYNSHIGKGNYLDVLEVDEYINKFKSDIKAKPFKLTKEYLAQLDYVNYSPELLFENILKSIKERYSNSSQAGGNKTLKKTKKKKSTKKKRSTKKHSKKRVNKAINKTKKGGGDGNEQVTVKSPRTKLLVESNSRKQHLVEEAHKIQNRYRIIWMFYALYLLFTTMNATNLNLFNTIEYKRILGTDNLLEDNTQSIVDTKLKEYLIKYFITPKEYLRTYLKSNKKEINSDANIYLLNCHGGMGQTYFEVPKNTIIVINTNLNKISICLSHERLYKIILDFKDTPMYDLYMNLYEKLVKLINPNAMIYLPGQMVNNMILTIERAIFEPLHSVKDNDNSNKLFSKFEETNGLNHTLLSLLEGDNSFKLFNKTQPGFKVIYIHSCNTGFNRDITIDYIYNYFMKLTSHYSNKNNTSNSILSLELIHTPGITSYNSNRRITEQTNSILSQNKNIYVAIIKLLIAGRDLSMIKKKYEEIEQTVPKGQINYKFILLILILIHMNSYYFIQYNKDAFNFIINKLYENKKKVYTEETEYNDEILKKHLKVLFDLYLQDLIENYINLVSTLIFTIYKNNLTVDIVSLLIDKNKQILTTLDDSGFTPLISYFINSKDKIQEEVVKILIDKDEQVLTIPAPNGFTPLISYLNHSNDKIQVEVVKILIDEGQQILTMLDPDGLTPLINYFINSKDKIQVEVVKILIDGEKQVLTIKDHNGFIPLISYLYISKDNIQVEVVEILIGEQQVLTIKGPSGITPLISYLIYSKNKIKEEVVKILIDKDEQVLTIPAPNGFTPLISYLNHSNDKIQVEVVKILIDEGQQVLTMLDPNQKTPLISYLSYSNDKIQVEVVKILIDGEKQVLTIKDHNGFIPLISYLYYFKDKIQVEVVEILIGEQQVLTIKGHNQKTPLISYLIYSKNKIKEEVVKILIDKNKQVLTIPAHNGFTPLISYLNYSNDKIQVEVVKILIDVDKKVLTMSDTQSFTPLISYFINSKNIQKEVVEILIDVDEQVLTIPAPNGFTPLISYLSYSKDKIQVEVVKILIDKGQQVLTMLDPNQKTPLDIYLSNSKDNIQEDIKRLLTPVN
jgi:hypothetical protein